jgi:hypothetical protein
VPLTPFRAIPLLLLSLFAAATPVAAQEGRWEVAIGPYDNPVDTAAVDGIVFQFARWPGEQATFRQGFRLYYNWGKERAWVRPIIPGNPFMFEERRNAHAVGVGIPLRYGPAAWSVRPFVEVEPGGAIYRSIDVTRQTNLNSGSNGLFDRSVWLLGPVVTGSAGVAVPGRGGFPRIQARAGYKVGWMVGQEGEGLTDQGWWQTWEVTGGASFRF